MQKLLIGPKAILVFYFRPEFSIKKMRRHRNRLRSNRMYLIMHGLNHVKCCWCFGFFRGGGGGAEISF